MVDILVASGLIVALVAVVTRPEPENGTLSPNRPDAPPLLLVSDHDLPCPWCGAATSEDDARCPSCRQRFG